MTRKSTGGGSAATIGPDYQARVSAWIAVRILAEQEASPPWDLPSDTVLKWLHCETSHEVDDIRVICSGDGIAFLQAKHTVDLEKKDDSDLASSLHQFVRQFVAPVTLEVNARPWERPLDAVRDRLVLVLGPDSSAPVRKHVPDLLTKLRALLPQQPLEDAATIAPEKRALAVIREHVGRSWQRAAGSHPRDADIRQLLGLIRVHALDVDPGQNGELAAKDMLRASVLCSPGDADKAWDALLTTCTNYARSPGGTDREALVQALLSVGVPLKAPRSYGSDIEVLKGRTAQTLRRLADFAQIAIGTQIVRIRRGCVRALHTAIDADALVVTGQPGSGKSGAMHGVVSALMAEGFDVVYLGADQLEAGSARELRTDLNLRHDLAEVLENWPGLQPGYLVIDGLDGARSGAAAAVLTDLIGTVRQCGSRWRLLVSIRKFDLRYSPDLQWLFRGTPPCVYQDAEFSQLRHFTVPVLTDAEMREAGSQSAPLAALLDAAGCKLRELLRVAFNLRLAGEMLGVGINPDHLTPIRTQLELLERYWRERVIRSDRRSHAREMVLHSVVAAMIEARSLQAGRYDMGIDAAASDALEDVLSAQVLVEWQRTPKVPPNRTRLAFAHNLLFDYAAERLALRGNPEPMIALMEQKPDLVLFLRPGIDLHFHYLWDLDTDRTEFWDAAVAMARSPVAPTIAKIIGPAAAAQLIKLPGDYRHLLAGFDAEDADRRTNATEVVGYMVAGLLATERASRPPLIGSGAPSWCDLLAQCSRKLDSRLASVLCTLLTAVCEEPQLLTDNQRALAGTCARRLLIFARAAEAMDGPLSFYALQAVCRTFASDSTASAALVRDALAPAGMPRFSGRAMCCLAQEVRHIIANDASLADEIFRTAFSNTEPAETATPIAPGQTSESASSRGPDYELALFSLTEAYRSFLEAAPLHATRALIAILAADAASQPDRRLREPTTETFDFRGHRACITWNGGTLWDQLRQGSTAVDSLALGDQGQGGTTLLAGAGWLGGTRRVAESHQPIGGSVQPAAGER